MTAVTFNRDPGHATANTQLLTLSSETAGENIGPAARGKEIEMEDHHEYRVKALGTGPRNGVIHAEGILPSILFSAPPEFLGEAGRWTPERA